ncbi:phasin family protein [Chitinivorax tropicus]|uniref:Phasin family protein n=1 Tax=Chitinivorax tropicus TaxID=714531 RepID=A0A840MNJ2_9PROT|nr:phasin family protein [Chitinivorax tropicus]MBB5020000.1 phasin family protein [Chitinivorax tropicus]
MFITPEKLAELQEINFSKAIRVSNIALGGIERLVNLQLEVTKSLIAESSEQAKSLSKVKDLQGLSSLHQEATKPSLDKALDVAKSFYEAASATQAEFAKVIEEEVVHTNKSVAELIDNLQKYAPAGSEVAINAIKTAVAAAAATYDNVTKAAQRVSSDLTEAGVAAATSSAKAVSAVSRKKTPATAEA